MEYRKVKCVSCKKTFELKIPVSFDGFEGFRIENHGCDKMYNYTSMVCIDEKKNKEWDEIFNWIKKGRLNAK